MTLPWRRISAALLALSVIVTVAARLWLNIDANGWSLGEAIWAILRYFTIWTNLLIACVGIALALGRPVDGRISAALLLAISAVALVYHTLLAGLTNFQGLAIVIDDMLHTVVPLWFAAHWLVFEPKSRLGFTDIPLWLAYPAIYCIYALIRAQIDGRYPYPFLDIGEKGIGQVAVNMAGLLVAFALGGVLIVLVARALSSGRMAQEG